MIDWKALTHQILERTDIAAEYESAGIELTAREPSKSGWIPCRAHGRDDRDPSAAICIASPNGSLGMYKDAASGEKASFFEMMVKLGRFTDWKAARAHYADVAGVALPQESDAKRKTKAPQVLWHTGDNRQPFAEMFASSKEGVTVEAVLRCSMKTGTWNGMRVLAFAATRPNEWATPCGTQLYRVDGSDFPAVGSKVGARKTHLLSGSVDGLILVGSLEDLRSAHTVWLCEGLTDALAVAAHLPAGYIAVTNSHGASTFEPSLAEAFQGKHVNILMDADRAGVKGGEIRAQACFGHAATVRIVRLPYEAADKHGKDARDYINEGHGQELLQLAESSAPLSAPPTIAAAPQEHVLSIAKPEGRTDVANACRLVARFGAEIRYVPAWKSWLAWDGRRWRPDDASRVDELAKQVAKELFVAANEIADSEETTMLRMVDPAAAKERLAALIGFAGKSSNEPKLRSMVSLAKSDPTVIAGLQQLDIDPWLLNCENGTLDLRTGELRPHAKDDYITKLAPVAYCPDARCPLWESALEKIMAGNGNLVRFLQRWFGYCLTGNVQEHVLPIFHGAGANGKSTITDAFLALLGSDYAIKAPSDFLMSRQGEPHPTERADLCGKRFVACVETEDGRRMAESLVKELTGGDRIRARRMREDFWEFTPTHKIVLATNHRPAIKGTDHAIWRRLRLVPFEVQFWDADKGESGPSELQAIKGLDHKLLDELPGILRWCVDGCLAWQREGLTTPPEVNAATDEYRADSDVIGVFIDQCCLTAAGLKVSASDLYAAYEAWSGGRGLSQRRFGSALTDRGFDRQRNNGIEYLGIGLPPETSFGERQERLPYRD